LKKLVRNLKWLCLGIRSEVLAKKEIETDSIYGNFTAIALSEEVFHLKSYKYLDTLD